MTNTPTPELPSSTEVGLREQLVTAFNDYIVRAGDEEGEFSGIDLAGVAMKVLSRASTPTDKEAGDREVIAKTLFDVGWPMSGWSDTGPHSRRAFCFMLADALIEKRRARSASVTATCKPDLQVQTTPPAHGEGELRAFIGNVLAWVMANGVPEDRLDITIDEILAHPTMRALSHASSPPQDVSGLVDALRRIAAPDPGDNAGFPTANAEDLRVIAREALASHPQSTDTAQPSSGSEKQKERE